MVKPAATTSKGVQWVNHWVHAIRNQTTYTKQSIVNYVLGNTPISKLLINKINMTTITTSIASYMGRIQLQKKLQKEPLLDFQSSVNNKQKIKKASQLTNIPQKQLIQNNESRAPIQLLGESLHQRIPLICVIPIVSLEYLNNNQ